MKNTMVEMEIKNLEKQIRLLKSKARKSKKGKYLADLYGICAGGPSLSRREIKRYEYRLPDKI